MEIKKQQYDESLSDKIQINHSEYELIIPITDERIGLEAFIVVYNFGTKGVAFGATRLWNYKSKEEALLDALRLSRGMSYKAAFIGARYGGAKGVIMDNSTVQKNRAAVFQRYAEEVEILAGKFITGTDMNLTLKDLNEMKKKTQYVVGFGSKPERYTAQGVVYAMQEAARIVFGDDDLSERTVAIQGLGKVGFELAKQLSGKVKQLLICDIDKHREAIAESQLPNAVVVDCDDFYKLDVDILAPCATGGMLNNETVDQINCKIIAGAANNQLATPEAGSKLYERNILYVPDYIANAGGLISVIYEYEHNSFDEEQVKMVLKNIPTSLRFIFEESRKRNLSTNKVTSIMAKKIYNLG